MDTDKLVKKKFLLRILCEVDTSKDEHAKREKEFCAEIDRFVGRETDK